jgi:hypothetical protein
MTWGKLWDAAQTLVLTATAQAVWLALIAVAVMLACRATDELDLDDTWW